MSNQENTSNTISLLPFLLFLGLFLGTGIVLSLQGVEFAFYQLPASIAIIPAILLAMVIGKYLSKTSLEQQVSQFIQGAGHQNIITMCLIYLLAGAFASVAKATGSVDASVQLGLSLFPTATYYCLDSLLSRHLSPPQWGHQWALSLPLLLLLWDLPKALN